MTAVFKKILIANRSEIASRIIATCTDMRIATVAVFSPQDEDAPFVRAADEAVALPEPSSYLDIEEIIRAAIRTEVTAVHPGYGFLAENAEFAAAVEAIGVVFIGPTPSTIAAMGAKIEALEMMASVGIPVLDRTVVTSRTDAVAIAHDVGFPLLVKASKGGGGKGMRVVHEPADLTGAIESAQREARAAFGDETVFLERFVEKARHVEVQIFGDRHGNVIHLYDRECSVQRRFQKVIEEAPAPFITDTIRRRLRDTAVTAARSVDYVGAGTVEFILEPDGKFAFLEMNTRLQVEHTVTEEVTGLDLVRMQIEIASGEHLPAQADVPPVVGHAIEARIYAERPADGYAPSTGTIDRFVVPKGVRVDTGIEDGSLVTHHFDPMVAKVIATAPSRTEAARMLGTALARSEIHGVSTNRDLVVAALSDTVFLMKPIDTTWLDRFVPAVTRRDPAAIHAPAAAAVLAIAQSNRDEAPVLATIASGWRNIRSQPNRITLLSNAVPVEATYTIGTGVPFVAIDGERVDITDVYDMAPDRVDMAVAGVRRRFRVHLAGNDVYVDSVLGSDHFTRPPRFSVPQTAVPAGSMISTTPGKVVAVNVHPGDVVVAGEVLVVVESMKMEQATVATVSGRVEGVAFEVGDQVGAGDVLVTIEESDGSDD